MSLGIVSGSVSSLSEPLEVFSVCCFDIWVLFCGIAHLGTVFPLASDNASVELLELSA